MLGPTGAPWAGSSLQDFPFARLGRKTMPHVQITWVEGRTPEMKRKIAERITAVLIEDGKAKRENIHVAFHDVPATNYAEAGVLVIDQKRTP
jgi:4-oxalocrotonate tautomerase